jgi:hypothetical protein
MSDILSRFPGYETARPLAELSSLDPAAFERDYVRRNRPVVVRGGAARWPCCEAWTLEGLRERLAGVEDLFAESQGLLEQRMREYAGSTVGAERDALREARPRGSLAHARVFLERIERGERLVAYAVPLQTPGLERMCADLGQLPFAPALSSREARFYRPRLFLYRGGYTDWHFHYADETCTVQARGTKEVLLLPPDPRTFATLWPIFRHQGSWEADPAAFRGLSPLKVRLQPGDVLYIPVFWWHAVEPVDDEIGATLALPFASSPEIQFDLRFAAARWTLQQAWSRPAERRWIPWMLLGGLWSAVRHPRGGPWRG